MSTQSILWTALPNGLTQEGRVRISVLVSPRLVSQNTPPQLGDFNDFVDWPETLRNSEFRLRLGFDEITIAGNQVTGPARVDDTIALASSEVWAAMLPPETRVRGFSFRDMSSSTIVSYSIHRMASRQRQLYSALARRDDDELPELLSLQNDPDWQDFIRDVGMLDRLYAETQEGMARNIDQQFTELKAGKQFPNLSSDQRDLALFQLFHTPPSTPDVQSYAGLPVAAEKQNTSWRTHRKPLLPSAAELAAMYDFHEIVSAMNQYPTLLRLMGLVIDFVIDADVLLPAPSLDLSVAVMLPETSDTTVTRMTEVSAKVFTGLDASNFSLLSSTAGHDIRIEKGLLDLGNERFELIQQDVDGTGIKAMNMARSLMRQTVPARRLDPTSRHERRSGVPALRNAGLVLVQNSRGDDLDQRFQNAAMLNAAVESQFQSGNPAAVSGAGLFAEDLVRGYRYDIWDDVTRRWHSLCRRKASYSIAGLPSVTIDDEEGISRLAATHAADGGSNDDVLYLHEMLVAWTGWSLCAPMPGRVVGTDDEHTDQHTVVPAGMPLSSQYQAVPGSLPRLRYGRKYWIRARAVDLASNSLPPFDKDYGPEHPEDHAQAYLRFDPLRAPVLALCRDPGDQSLEAPEEGESMQRMAIRSFNATPDLNTVDTTAVTHRAVLAERSSVKDAEVHGKLDAAGQVDAGIFQMLATTDADLQTVAVASIPQPLALPGAPLGSTDYAVHETGAALPYLPDPVCVELAARLFDHPDISDQVIIPITLYGANGKWPAAQPLRIELYESSGAMPEFVANARLLKVPLPKACRARLRLSVKPDKATLELMGIWHWLTDKDKNALEQRALNGQHWMLTPWREVELVHAVQKPLISPDLTVRIVRQVNKTWAIPVLTSPVSLKSTERMDLLAAWHEPAANPDNSPKDNPRHDHAFSLKITEEKRYRGKPDHLVLKPDLIRAGSKGSSHVADKVHEFNDTRYRRIEYHLEASSAFREYMPAAILTELDNNNHKRLTDKNIKVSGLPVVAWIPSSAPPPTPKVSYVMPTYQWVRVDDTGKTQSWRRSGGFRVYLEGTWYGSGYGEMLAVVMPGDAMQNLDPNTNPVSQALKNLVTQWGNDPIWKSPFLNGPSPKLRDFPLARTQADASGAWLPEYVPNGEAHQPPGAFAVSNLPHPGIRNASNTSATEKARKLVNIAPHDVAYDAARNLWYCDIDLAPKASYYPFVRLALARYQPVSVQDCYLSNIVLADFMTLPNDRYVSITHSSDPLKHTVQVSGATYSDSSGHAESLSAPQGTIDPPGEGAVTVIKAADVSESTVVEVWVEKLNEDLGEDFGWEKDTSATITPASGTSGPFTPGPVFDDIRFASAAVARDTARPQIRRRSALSRSNELIQAGITEAVLAEVAVVLPALWEGSVTLPASAANDGLRRRIVVAEYEEYFIDDDGPYDATPTLKDRRLVYADHIELV